METRSDLSKRMIDIADRDNLPADHKMRVVADAFDLAILFAEPKKLLGAWARARRVYCEYTGETLI